MTAPWSAPDAKADEAAAVVGDGATTTAGSSTDAGAWVEAPVDQHRRARDLKAAVALRPMTTSDVIDGGIAVIKAAPGQILAIAAVTVLPIEFVSAWISRDSLDDRGVAGAFQAAVDGRSANNDITGSTVVLWVISGLLLAIVTGAVATLVAGWYAERVPTTGEALSVSFRRFPALAVAWVVVHLIELATGLLLFVPLLFVMPLLAVVTPVVVVERAGPFRAIGRSWSLARRRYSPMIGAVLLIAISDAILTIAISGIAFLFSGFSFGWIVDAVAVAGSALITTPFVAGAVTLLYFDLRVRSEGLDLELSIAEHFSTAGAEPPGGR